MLLKAHGKSLRGLFGSERFLPVWINNPDSIANAKVTFMGFMHAHLFANVDFGFQCLL